MKVLVVSSKYCPEYAGSGLRAHNTYKRLAARFGVEFDVVASSLTTNRSRDYVYDGVSVRLIANKYSKGYRHKKPKTLLKRLVEGVLYRWHWQCNYWLEAWSMLIFMIQNASKYDLFHVFGNVTITSVAISYAKITGKPLIVELVNLVDDPHPYEPRILSWIFGKGFPKQTRLVCLSKHLKQACLNHGYRETQIWCRPNPIHEAKFNAEPCKSPEELRPFSPSDVLILHLAKFMPRKNQLFMVQVMLHLPDPFKLILAGPLVDSGPLCSRDQEYYQSIQETITRNHLETRVRLIPRFIENPEAYMKAADVFVLPATGEAFGTPFIEAIACGVPSVVNHIPGVFDRWIKPGVNGYICTFDPAEWAEKITLAARIDPNTLKQASVEVLRKASTEVIDREYHRQLTVLSDGASQ